MTWKPSTPTGAVHQDCLRCGAPVLHQKHGLPFTVTADAERLTPAQAAARTTRNRLAWCLRESKWAGARLVEVLGRLHNPACPWPHVVDHECPPGTPLTPKPEGALW
ncbi:MAG TPA: hypothetical protein VKZ89_12465 [Thermobifida alba]|nr:hypothetical protein [Thermobifida alba]